MSLSTQAERLLEQMQQAEGTWLSATDGRSKRSSVDELMDHALLTHGKLHDRDGYILTRLGKQYGKADDKEK